MKINPMAALEVALENVNNEIELSYWMKDRARRRELKRLAKGIRKDMKNFK